MDKKFKQPLYALLRRAEDGTLEGYIELTFCMDYDPKLVRVWNKQDFLYILRSNPRLRKNPYIPVRLRSKKCPIVVDLQEGHTKFTTRNKNFTLKDK